MINNNSCKFILLLGGTGPIGIYLSKVLSKNGYCVVVTSRKEHKDTKLIRYVKGNAKEKVFLSSILLKRKWDCIVDFMTYKTSEFKDIYPLLLDNTLQYIFLSSSRVYADVSPITEKSPRIFDVCKDQEYLMTDEYALYKAREEDILLNSKYDNYTIVRPYITFAENRLPLGIWEKETWLQRVLQGKDIAIQKDVLDKYTTVTFGEDVSTFLAGLVNNERALGIIVNISSGSAMRWCDILNYYLDSVERKIKRRPKVWTYGRACYSCRRSIKMLFCDIVSLGCIKRKRSDYSLNYQLEYDRMYNRIFDTSLANSIKRIDFCSVKSSLEKCLFQFSDKPMYNYVNWELEFVHDRACHNYTLLSQIPTIKLKIKYILIRYIIPQKYIFID